MTLTVALTFDLREKVDDIINNAYIIDRKKRENDSN